MIIIRTIERQKALDLRSQGFSIKEIAKKLKVSKGSVSIWVRKIKLTGYQKIVLKQKAIEGGIKGRESLARKWREYRLTHPKPIKTPKLQREVESFFNTWTPNMAYILGYFAADGYMYKNKNQSCYTGFLSTDKELIVYVKNLMKATNKIEVRDPKGNEKRAFIIQIGSKKLFNRLLELGFTPNKSSTLKFPPVPNDLLCHFTRGYFDGDGCAFRGRYLRKDRGEHSYYNSLTIRLTCGSKKFLKKMQIKLSSTYEIGTGSLHSHGKTVYELTYSYHNVVKLFSFLYPSTDIPFLRRKYFILKEGKENWGRSSVG